MKRPLLGILAALGLALGLSSTAQAQTALQTITQNGVTCSQYSSGFGSTYPTSMWDCANPTNPGNDISNVTQPALNIQTSPTDLKSSIANVQLYLFANAADYASFTGATAPAANAFGATTTNLAAAFTTATQNGASVDLTNDIGGSILQELGHFNDAAQTTPFSSNAAFTTALAYDEAYMNAQPNNIWPSAYYTEYPGLTNWQIFQAIYPSANTDIFNYQFMANTNSSSLPSDLYNVLVNFMPNTRGWVKNYVFLATPANPAVATNGVLCVQQFTNFGTYPTSMWDCLNPYNPGNEVSNITQPALNLQTTPTDLKASLANVQLYAFKNASDYVSFTGAAAPAANAFGATTTNLAAAFGSAVQNGVTVDLTGDYSGSILEQLGHLNDAAQASPYSGNAVFTTALAYDEAYMNAQPNNIWPSAYYTQYPGMTNWQIFQAIYPSATTDIFNYQFNTDTNNTSVPSDLYNVLVNYMPNTRGWVKNYVFLATPANPAVATDGVLCVQQFTNFGTYPTYMWDCVTPYNPGNEVSNITQPALNLQSDLKASVANVDLYAFANATDFANFTGAPAPAANAFGATTTNLAAAFARATQNGVTVDLSGNYGSSIVQELGHMLDQVYQNPSASGTFTSDLSADVTFFNAQANAWPSAYYTQYPSLTNWQILQAIYPNAATDIFNYQFMVFDNQSTVSDLENVLVNDMPNTKAFMGSCFGNQPAIKAGQFQPRASICEAQDPSTSNGVSCKLYLGNNYPEDGHFYDCSTAGTYAEQALAQLNSLFTNFPNVALKLKAESVEFYVFDNAVQFGTYSGAVPSQYSASAFYNLFANISGITTNPDTNPNVQISSVWGNTGTAAGNYPATTLTPSIANDIAHEGGHSFDFVSSIDNDDVNPSYSTEMNRVATLDVAYMDTADPTASADRTTYAYWLEPNSGNPDGVPNKHWAETFAELFAINSVGNTKPVDPYLTTYYECSNLFTKTWMQFSRNPTSQEYINAGLSRCQ